MENSLVKLVVAWVRFAIVLMVAPLWIFAFYYLSLVSNVNVFDLLAITLIGLLVVTSAVIIILGAVGGIFGLYKLWAVINPQDQRKRKREDSE